MVGAWLALRGGLRVEQNGIEWCDEILHTLLTFGGRGDQ